MDEEEIIQEETDYDFTSWHEFREQIEEQEQTINKTNDFYEQRKEAYYEGDFN